MEIIFYKDKEGNIPIREFLDQLDDKMRSKVLLSIKYLQNFGCELREPHSKSLGDGIFKLRAKFGNNISRVLYFFVVGDKAILTNGFIKKTQKTPIGEIEFAKKCRQDYLNGGANNG